MEQATIVLIQTISTDAIKILGPAIIATVATYYASKSQFELKLKEIDKKSEFDARKSYFEIFKERQSKLGIDYEKLSESLGEIIGFTTGAKDESESFKDILVTYHQLVLMYIKLTPLEMESTLRDMKKYDLKDYPEYDRLTGHIERMKNLDTGDSFEDLKSNIIEILQAYATLLMCNQMVLQVQMDKVFSKYVELTS